MITFIITIAFQYIFANLIILLITVLNIALNSIYVMKLDTTITKYYNKNYEVQSTWHYWGGTGAGNYCDYAILLKTENLPDQQDCKPPEKITLTDNSNVVCFNVKDNLLSGYVLEKDGKDTKSYTIENYDLTKEVSDSSLDAINDIFSENKIELTSGNYILISLPHIKDSELDIRCL